jgi:two-component system cell cycle sensor histidine kinase/response regulator CckA
MDHRHDDALADCEQQLRKSRERESMLRCFFDDVDMMRGIVEIAGDRILHVFVNQTAAEFWGISGDLINECRVAEDGLPGVMRPIWLQHFEESRRTGVPVTFEHESHGAKGIRYLSTTVRLLGVASSGHARFNYVTIDITERKRLEAQFLQAQKMEAIGVLASGIAHDFNNLLNVIHGYADCLLREPDQDPSRRKDLEHIIDAVQRAASLTSQLLAFSRRQVLQVRTLDLNDSVVRTRSLLRRLIGEDIDLAFQLQPGLGLVMADPGQVEQVIMNLAINARDAMPEGGRFTIETANVEIEEEYDSHHRVMPAGSYVMVAVSDNGHGMDPEAQTRIFEPFFTTKRTGGTGLGLSTVYGIVKQSGGFIWVYSEVGAGTTFKIYLPRVWGTADPYRHEAAKERALHGSETILVVEDEEFVREPLARILRSHGYSVLEASNSSEAQRQAREYDRQIHLVLSDVVLPDQNGRAMSIQIAKMRPGIKTLFISGYPENAIVRHGVLDANIAFLPKPFGGNALARKVREVLDSAD